MPSPMSPDGGRQHRLHAAALRHHPYAAGPCAAAFGHPGRFAADDSAAAMAALIDENTRALFCESVGNPAGNICDIEAIAEVAHAHGVPLIVDNTVATPILLRPIEHGADIVVHSLTKFMGGHGAAMGGIVVDGGKFRLDGARRALSRNSPRRTNPIMAWSMPSVSAAPPSSRAPAASMQRTTGAILSPMSAFLLLQGIETVALRVERHVENARAVAEFLHVRCPRRVGGICRLARQPLSRPGAEISRRHGAVASDLRRQGRL